MPTIIENRRNLHQIPEIELTTQKTAQYIENVLDLYDCTIDHPIPNSVTAYFNNKKEKSFQKLSVSSYRQAFPDKIYQNQYKQHYSRRQFKMYIIYHLKFPLPLTLRGIFLYCLPG